MIAIKSFIKVISIIILLSLVMTTTVSAGPAFKWSSFDLNVSHSKCVKRAAAAIASEIVVDKIKKRPNGAAAWNKNTSIVVHCVAIGKDKSKSIIFVSAFESKGLSDTLAQIQAAMRSGVFE